MATFSTSGEKLTAPAEQVLTHAPYMVTGGYRHKNDAEKSTHHVYMGDITTMQLPAQPFLAGGVAQHKTLLSTLYAAQDQYILDVWHEVENGTHIIKTLANSKTADHFVFIRDEAGTTYTSIQPANSSYQVATASPIVPKEVYAATPSRVLYITDSDNFEQATVLTSTYAFGSICDTTDLENQLAQCQAERDQLQADLNQCQSDLAQAQQDLATCQNDLTTCQNSLSSCQGDLTTCNNNLATCNDNLTTCQNDLTTCNTNLSNCQTENTQLTNDLNTCTTNLTNCQTTVTNQQQTIDTLNTQVTDLQNQVITLQTSLTAAQNEIATLQAALADCQANSNPYITVLNHTIVEKDGGILVQVDTEHNSDLYLFVKQKSTGEIIKSVRSLTSTQNHTIFIPISRGDYIIDYLAVKPA